ncbi:MAG: hypothetical protein ACYC27_08775 [Armatimonadota bacterium]
MDGIFTWINDKKNLPIVIAAAAIILVLFFVFMKMTGKIGGSKQQAGTEGKAGTNIAGTTGTGSPNMMATNPMSSGMPGGGMQMPSGMPMMPGGMSGMGTNDTQPAAPPGIKLPPMLPFNKDPFQHVGGEPTKADLLTAKLSNLSHTRFAPMPLDFKQSDVQESLPAQPNRRLAGILWNGKVSAMLETNGEMDIIRPGMVLDKGNSKVIVDSIQANSVILKTLDTKKPFTIKINLTGSPNAASQNATAIPGNMMMPGGMPGGMPMMPGGMMPGGMPGGMPGMIMPMGQ